MSKDVISEEFLHEVATANRVIQDSYLLAARIALFQEMHPDQSLPFDLYDEVEDLNEQADDISHLDITFSGRGCIPTILPDGDPGSIYGHAEILTGSIEYFALTSPSYMTYESPDDIDEFEDGSLLMLPQDIEEIKKKMIQPEQRLSLYGEFFLRADPEEEIAGTSVRVPAIEYYALIESSTLRVINIESKPVDEACDQEDIPLKLMEYANQMRNKLADTRFRRMPVASQVAEIDSVIGAMNRDLKMDRFMMVFDPQDIYVPDTSNDNHRMTRFDISSYPYELVVECLRVDSLEHLALTNGLFRINNNIHMRDHTVAYCIVGSINELTQKSLGLPSNILWIPVRPLPRTRRKLSKTTIPTVYKASFELIEEM